MDASTSHTSERVRGRACFVYTAFIQYSRLSFFKIYVFFYFHHIFVARAEIEWPFFFFLQLFLHNGGEANAIAVPPVQDLFRFDPELGLSSVWGLYIFFPSARGFSSTPGSPFSSHLLKSCQSVADCWDELAPVCERVYMVSWDELAFHARCVPLFTRRVPGMSPGFILMLSRLKCLLMMDEWTIFEHNLLLAVVLASLGQHLVEWPWVAIATSLMAYDIFFPISLGEIAADSQ